MIIFKILNHFKKRVKINSYLNNKLMLMMAMRLIEQLLDLLYSKYIHQKGSTELV
jgi:hypothetical protein